MFVAIDGPDGAGKTTLAQSVVDTLNRAYGIRSVYTCEPTKSETGRKISYFLRHGGASKEELLELFLIDRKEHITNEIIPKLQKGFIVVSDRYKYSTVCYQHLQGFDLETLVNSNGSFIVPDITFILLLDYSQVLYRLASRETKDLLENDDFIQRSIKIYSEMYKLFPDESFIYIDSSRNHPDLTKEVIKCILDRMDTPE